MGGKGMCGCAHHKIAPWAFVIIGLAIVLQTLGVLTGMWIMLIVGVLFIVIGGVKISGRNCKCCGK